MSLSLFLLVTCQFTTSEKDVICRRVFTALSLPVQTLLYVPNKLPRAFPEAFVHCQIDERVTDVVDVVQIQNESTFSDTVIDYVNRHKAEYIDDGDENELLQSRLVTSIGL